MSIKVGINGSVVWTHMPRGRAKLSGHRNRGYLLEPDYLAYMLKYDSGMASSKADSGRGNTLIVNSKKIRLTA